MACDHPRAIWTGGVTNCQCCKADLTEGKVLIDGNVRIFSRETWACVCQVCYDLNGLAKWPFTQEHRGLGVGYGQRYELRDCGHWVKTDG